MAVAGSIVTSRESDDWVTVVSCLCTVNASGACTENGFVARGFLIGMVMKPVDLADGWDLTLLDAIGGVDVINGAGANMSNLAGMTLAEKYIACVDHDGGFLYFNGVTLYPTIANGGNATYGTIDFVFSKIHPGIRAVA